MIAIQETDFGGNLRWGVAQKLTAPRKSELVSVFSGPFPPHTEA